MGLGIDCFLAEKGSMGCTCQLDDRFVSVLLWFLIKLSLNHECKFNQYSRTRSMSASCVRIFSLSLFVAGEWDIHSSSGCHRRSM